MDDDIIFREIYLDEQCREAMCEADSKAVLGEVAPEKVLGFYQCGKCGAELKKHNKNNFCYYCGVKLDWRNLA